ASQRDQSGDLFRLERPRRAAWRSVRENSPNAFFEVFFVRIQCFAVLQLGRWAGPSSSPTTYSLTVHPHLACCCRVARPLRRPQHHPTPFELRRRLVAPAL